MNIKDDHHDASVLRKTESEVEIGERIEVVHLRLRFDPLPPLALARPSRVHAVPKRYALARSTHEGRSGSNLIMPTYLFEGFLKPFSHNFFENVLFFAKV